MKENNNEDKEEKKLESGKNNQNGKRARKISADNGKERKSPRKKVTKQGQVTENYEESNNNAVPATSKDNSTENKVSVDLIRNIVFI